MLTIILAHPWHGSFNKAILDTITAKCDKINKPYKVIDLNKDNFNPVMTEPELALYSEGKAIDPLVTMYQEVLKETTEIVFIFPIWWGTMPAILKGFFDKVLLKDLAYNYNNGWTPLLKINKSTIISTSESETSNFKLSIEDTVIPNMLMSVGINNTLWLNCDSVTNAGDKHRKAFLEKVDKEI